MATSLHKLLFNSMSLSNINQVHIRILKKLRIIAFCFVRNVRTETVTQKPTHELRLMCGPHGYALIAAEAYINYCY